MPRALQWLENTLPTLEADGYIDQARSPEEQAEALIYEYIAGEPLKNFPPHSMLPEGDGIWELRTPDLRFFGWFWRCGQFIVSAIDTKERCKSLGLYGGYRNQAVSDRVKLDLDDPKFITGSMEDVL